VGKFISYAPAHVWLLSKPYRAQQEFGGDLFGARFSPKPAEVQVELTFVLGKVAHARPTEPPTVYVEGTHEPGHFFSVGKVSFAGKPTQDVFSHVATVRKYIGDVKSLKIVPAKAKTGAELYFVDLHAQARSEFRAYPVVRMVPGHMFVGPKPFKPLAFYTGNPVVAELVLAREKKRANWDGRTCGGSAPKNSKCKFPFIYNGITYNKCTSAGRSKYEMWCETTAGKNTWAYCDCDRYTTWQGNVGPGLQCKLPFKKNGVWHDDCIAHDKFAPNLRYLDSHGRKLKGNMPNGVCSVDAIFKGRWAACQSRGLHPSIAQVARFTNGQGSALAGTKCTFPFFFKNVWTFNCIGDAYGGFGWCATTTIFKDAWGGCREPLPKAERYIRWPEDVNKPVGKHAAPDEQCAFPFRHNGGVYHDCADVQQGVLPWGWYTLAPHNMQPCPVRRGAL
jgi:hypothetical protein